MKVVLSPQSEKRLRGLNKVDQISLAQKIRQLQEERISGVEKLQGYKDIFRVRVGDFRLVYKKFANRAYVILIAHRKDIYELLRQLLG